MSTLKATYIAVLGLTLLGCSSSSFGLFEFEEDFLAEDVSDMMRVVFHASDNALAGDDASELNIFEPATAANGFTVRYSLPAADRPGLGFGSGEVALRIVVDGTPVEDPFAFSFAGSDGLEVAIDYRLDYDGETPGSRFTVVTLDVNATARRDGPTDEFFVEYFVRGFVDLGVTRTDVLLQFFAPGRPVDGIAGGLGDGEGVIDDPEIGAGVFDYDIDWGDLVFRVEGEVGSCCEFRSNFSYADLVRP